MPWAGYVQIGFGQVGKALRFGGEAAIMIVSGKEEMRRVFSSPAPQAEQPMPDPIIWPEPESEIDRIWKAVEDIARGS